MGCGEAGGGMGRRLRNARREIFGGCGWKAVAEFWGR